MTSPSSRSARWSLYGVLLVVAGGCIGEAGAPTSPKPSESLNRVAVHTNVTQTFDDELLAIALSSPGFTGVSVAQDGSVALSGTWSELPDDIDDVMSRIASTFRMPHLKHAPRTLRTVPYDFRALRDALDKLWAVEVGVLYSSDIDEVAGVLRFGVESAAGAARLRESLESVEVDAEMYLVTVEEFPTVHQSLRSPQRPTVNGLQISFAHAEDACSLGLNVFASDIFTGYPDVTQRHFMTASHCSRVLGQVTGTRFGQPLNSSGAQHEIGIEFEEALLFFGPPVCPPGVFCMLADALVVAYHDSVSSGFGTVARSNAYAAPFSTDPPILSLSGHSNVVNGVFVGHQVRKTGRSSGDTWGTVQQTCQNQPFNNVPGSTPSTYMVLCTVRSNYTSGKGDSGGTVWLPTQAADPATPRTAGLHIGGTRTNA